MNASEILFRCSSLGNLLTEPQGKSNYEKYTDACVNLRKLESDYENIKNKGTKTAENKLASIEKCKALIAELNLIKDKKELSKTCKKELIKVFVLHKYNRFREITAKFFEKGNCVEEDSITIISRITKQFFKKNEQRLSNEFIQGTPDLFKGESIFKADLIKDAKSSWDVQTFNEVINESLTDNYYWQGQGYMWLTGASKCTIDYCLNNTPFHLVMGELRKESYNYPDGDTPAWIELQIIANHVYDSKTFLEYINLRGIQALDENTAAIIDGFVEIPLEERHFSFEFERNESDIERIKERVIECRNYMNEQFF